MWTSNIFNYPFQGIRVPLSNLERMRRLLDNFTEGDTVAKSFTSSGVFPPLNLTEDKDNYYLRAELPGIQADELDIQVTGKSVSISGERKIASQEQNVKYHRRERDAGKFSRILNIPGDINSDHVDAKLENGLLSVVIPKAEVAKPKQISVK